VAEGKDAPARQNSPAGPPVTDLVAAMKAAVDSVDARPRASANRPRPDRDSVKVRVLDEHDLPPVSPKRGTTTFAGTLSATFGPAAAWTWLALHEVFLFIALFWTVALVMAAVAPGLATLAGVVTSTVILRVALLVVMRSHLRGRRD
jgi:hypothetical protein